MASNAVRNAATFHEDVPADNTGAYNTGADNTSDSNSGVHDSGPILNHKFEVMELIGSGALGQIFLCRNLLLNNMLVAVKVLDGELCADEARLNKFRAELAKTLSISHANLVRVFDYFADQELEAYSLEYVPGSSLEALLHQEANSEIQLQNKSVLAKLDDRGRLDELLRIGLEICAGLRALHEAGLRHGHLTLENVLLARSSKIDKTLGTVKLTNYGISLPSESGPSRDYTPDAVALARILEQLSDNLFITKSLSPKSISAKSTEKPRTMLNELITRIISGQHGDGLHAILKTERALGQLREQLRRGAVPGSGDDFAGEVADESTPEASSPNALSASGATPSIASNGFSIFVATLALLAMIFSLFGSDESQSSSGSNAAKNSKNPPAPAAVKDTTPKVVVSNQPPEVRAPIRPEASLATSGAASTESRPETSPEVSSAVSTAVTANAAASPEPFAPPMRTVEAPPAAPPTTKPTGNQKLVHKVTYPGETLSIISDWYLGDVLRWQELAKANPKINPSRIEKGQEIVIPTDHLARRDPLPESHIAAVNSRSTTQSAKQ